MRTDSTRIADEALDEEQRVRLKLLSPLGVAQHLAGEPGAVTTVKLKVDPQGKIVVNAAGHIDAAAESPPGNARGVAFLLDLQLAPIARDILAGLINDLWIILRGDFVLDTNGNAIDAEFEVKE